MRFYYIILIDIIINVRKTPSFGIKSPSVNCAYILDFKHVILYYILQEINITMLIINNIYII